MPLTKLTFKPGVNREMTSYSNEGSWFQTEKVRFRFGFPEKIGGWKRDTGSLSTPNPAGTFSSGPTVYALTPSSGTFWGSCKSMYNWLNLVGYNLLGLGTSLKYYIQYSPDGQYYDVTPIRLQSSAGAVTFSATNGSTTITVNWNSNGVQAGDFVSFSGASSLGGNITASVLNAEFRVVSVTGGNLFTITSPIAANSFDVGNGGASVIGYAQLNSGNASFSYASGWGAGGWGGTVGSSTVVTTLSAGINSSVTTIPVVTTTNLPSSGAIIIDSEIILYTGATTTTLTGCTRGYLGTTAASHSLGASVVFYANGWGQSSAAGIGVVQRLWSQSAFGENLIFAYRGGPICLWAVNQNPNSFDRGQVLVAGGSVTQKNYATGTGTTTVSIDSTCPSLVNQVMVSDSTRFVIALGSNDPTGVVSTTVLDPLMIRWSDQESYSTWTPAVTNQAGSYRLSQGSQIVQAVQTRQEILIFTDLALYSMQYIGAPYVWSFQPMGSNISIISPNSVVTANNMTYWMGIDKFYVYSGKVDTLPCALRRDIFDNINSSQGYQVYAGQNEGFNEIWWFYCSANANIPDKYVIYNYVEGTWYNGTLSRTSWLGSRLRTYPMACTYDPTADSGKLIYHENGTDDGSVNPAVPISASIQSADFDIGDGDHFAYVWRIVPDVTFDGSNATAPVVNMTMLPRHNPGSGYGSTDNPSVISGNNYSGQRTFAVQKFTEYAYVRVRGRQMSLQISSDSLGVQWQLGSPRLDTRPDGRR